MYRYIVTAGINAGTVPCLQDLVILKKLREMTVFFLPFAWLPTRYLDTVQKIDRYGTGTVPTYLGTYLRYGTLPTYLWYGTVHTYGTVPVPYRWYLKPISTVYGKK